GRSGVTGPGGLRPDAWLRDLQRRNQELALQADFEPLRADAERQARAGGAAPRPLADETDETEPALPPEGTLAVWRADPGEVPPVKVRQAQGEWSPSEWWGAAGWLALLALASLVALSPLLRGGARRLWPEVNAGLGVLGWSLVGPTPVVLFLLALGLCGRLLLIVREVRRHVALRQPASSPSGSGS